MSNAHIVAVVIAASLVSASAFADDATTPPPAPENQINGQLVPVGTRGDYLKSFEHVNIATNPIAWLGSEPNVSVSYALTDHVVVRGDVNVAGGNMSKGYEVGASMPIYLRRAYAGPFIEPGIIARSLTSQNLVLGVDSSSMESSTSKLVGPEMLAGYHWKWDSGLNVAIALGAVRNISALSGTNETVSVDGYLRVGHTF